MTFKGKSPKGFTTVARRDPVPKPPPKGQSAKHGTRRRPTGRLQRAGY
jgi:hypothetical protein